MEKIFLKLKDLNVKTVFCTKRIENTSLHNNLKKIGFTCFFLDDPRSLSYFVIGFCEVEKTIGVIICDADNEFRNLASGLTEAFYRCLPVLVIAAYEREGLHNEFILNDIAKESAFYKKDERLYELERMSKDNYPRVFFVENQELNKKKTLPNIVQDYLDLLPGNCKFISDRYNNQTNILFGGTLSFAFGVALKSNCDIYCVLSFEELIVEINICGNKHFPTNLKCIVLDSSSFDRGTIIHFCDSLGIQIVYSLSELSSIKNKSIFCFI